MNVSETAISRWSRTSFGASFLPRLGDHARNARRWDFCQNGTTLLVRLGLQANGVRHFRNGGLAQETSVAAALDAGALCRGAPARNSTGVSATAHWLKCELLVYVE